MKNTKLWSGLTSVFAVLLVIAMLGNTLAAANASYINSALGINTARIVETGTAPDDTTYYKSQFGAFDDAEAQAKAIAAALEQNVNEMREGAALLRNENNTLPLTNATRISVFGHAAVDPAYQANSAGNKVTNGALNSIDLKTALEAQGFEVNPQLWDGIAAGTATRAQGEAPQFGGGYSVTGTATNTEENKAFYQGLANTWANDYKDAAIVVFAREGGEGHDLLMDDVDTDGSTISSLALHKDERDLLEMVRKDFHNVIALLHSPYQMAVQDIPPYADSIPFIGYPGHQGFTGVAEILKGTVNPSGHLTDTYAVKNANSPAAQNFGDLQWTNANPDIQMNDAIVEAENIYIGYKYYETRYFDTVMNQGNASSTVGSSTGSAWNYDDEVTYPFGYGLSYTTFTQTLDDLNVDLDNETVTAKVTVTNTGSVAGKDVVQLYVSLPYTDYDKVHGVEKAAVQLLDYGKTAELAPGASETVTITADMQNMASWDSTADNAAGTKGCYILDAGDYYFTIGNGAHEAVQNVLAAEGQDVGGNADKAKSWNLGSQDTTTFATTKNGTAVENQLADMDVNYWLPGTATYLTRADWEGTFPKTYKDLTATDEMIDILDNDIYEINANGDPSTVTFGADNGLTLADLKGVSDINDERWDMLMDEITLEECMIRTGFGGTSTKVIESIMSPETIQNDGPNGIYSYPLGQYANTDKASGDPCAVDANDPNLAYKFGTMVNETVIAQTFNKDLAADYGRVIGNYSLWANTTIFWGIGTNLYRLPYNARNHEYCSEDAVLTAGQGTAYAAAAMEYGVIIAPKHLAFNDTEINRTGVSVFMTEQQARENELRGTQGIVENAHVLGVMTAYNRVGITQDNAHTGLTKNILRNEWGFQGLISEDFIQNANYVVLKEAVLNGVTMSCNTGDNTMAAVSEKYPYWTVEAVSQDTTMMTALKQAMKYQNYALANSNAMDGMASNTKLVSVRTWYDNALTAVQIVFAALTVLAAAMYVLDERKSKKQ